MFEDTVLGTPILDDQPFPDGHAGSAFYYVRDGWQDLQGSIRLTMLSGSYTIDLLKVTAIRLVNGQRPSYSETLVQVPEPGTPLLLLTGVAACAALRWKRRASRP